MNNPFEKTNNADSLPDLLDDNSDFVENENKNNNGLENNNSVKSVQSKCPKCGSTDIVYSIELQSLVCNYCHNTLNVPRVEKSDDFDESIQTLSGEIISNGAKDINADSGDLVTLKCQSCGAEVVVNTSNTTSARCHWCRNTLSINDAIPNGAVPDSILPFTIKKEDAIEKIREYASQRRFFANRTFIKEFNPENVLGVYFPYLLVDTKSEHLLNGFGEHKTGERVIHEENGNNTILYNADGFKISRSFKMITDDLLLESSKEFADLSNSSKSNNIINAVLPFDTKNALKFDSNYLKGFNSEKRDLNTENIKGKVEDNLMSMARAASVESLEFYDRGVSWKSEGILLDGIRWNAIYLPIWLYSYYQKDKNFTHYIAVNGRTGSIIGSVPINTLRLSTASVSISVASIIILSIVSVFLGK